jgi:two-component sensor histidine kinase/PAS domain-containing protein
MSVNIPYIVYVIAYLISAILLTATVLYVWSNRKLLHPNYILIILIGAWVWLTCQLCEYLFDDFALKVLFNKLQYLGAVILPPAWLSFSIYFIDHKFRKSVIVFSGSIVFLVVFFILIMTNDYHKLLWHASSLSRFSINIRKDFTAFYYIFLAYAYLLVMIGFFYLILKSLPKKHFERKQSCIVFLGVILPLFAQVAGLFLPPDYSYMDFTPIGFSFSSICIIYFARLRYYRTIPLAQHIITQSMTDILLIVNPDNQLIYMNPAGYEFFRISFNEAIGKELEELIPGLAPAVDRSSAADVRNEELVFKNVYYDLSISTIMSWNKKPTAKVLVMRDINRLKNVEENLKMVKDSLEARVNDRTSELAAINAKMKAEIVERKKTEDKLKASLSEKEVLLGEIHHRVKNNLQIIMSLLKLQKKQLPDKQASESFNTAILRIQSIAMIHEKLYKSNDLANTNFADYINHLTHEIVYSHSDSGAAIFLTINAQNILLDIDRSILCGLILNELILNVVKYAFPPGFIRNAGGMNTLSVGFLEEKETYKLVISDNGIGLPVGYDGETNSTLGMKIIKTLVKQLSGSLEISSGEGTTASIRFPKKKLP